MFYKGKKVLVAGASGMIGSHVVEELLKRGACVRATRHERVPAILDKEIEYLSCDLTNKEECARAVRGMEMVFMCAAATYGAGIAASNPLAFITPNLLMESQMLEAACLAGVERFLMMSSSTVYPPFTHPVKEEEAFSDEPHESYFGVGWMKRYLEKLAEFYYKRYNLKVAIMRPTSIYGPYDVFNPERSHVLPALIRKAVEKLDPFEVWGNGEEIRDFLHARDLARGSLDMLEHHAVCDPITFGYGKGVKIKAILQIILQAAGHENARVIFNSSKPGTIPIRMVDISKAKRVLGFEPLISLEDGIHETVKWYMENRKEKSKERANVL